MTLDRTDWDVNLRANLRLWPTPLPNVQQLCRAIDEPWDEQTISDSHFATQPGEDHRRAVRQTFEAMAYEGLLIRDEQNVLRTTRLGDFVLSFLGLLGGPTFANTRNRSLLSGPLVNGLAVIIEVRIIWRLMRGLDGTLSNEELNRAMSIISSESDVPQAIQSVRDARQHDDPTRIGPRIYDAEKYGTSEVNDQRKAMNPHFLLAGGGGVFIDLDQGTRRLHPEVENLVDGALRRDLRLTHAATDRAVANMISKASLAPVRHF